jgi:hypothetical protein
LIIVYEGRTITDRRVAGTMLLSKVRLAERARITIETDLATLGGFTLACVADRSWHREFEANLMFRRNDHDQLVAIEDDLTPMGLISRLEYLLDRFELDLQEQERREHEAASRCAGYEERADQAFPLQAELDGKLANLAALDADLAQTAKKAA